MADADFEIRPMAPGETEAIAAIYHRVWHETHAPLVGPEVTGYRGGWFFLERIRGYDPPPQIACCDGRPVGFVAWEAPRLRQLWLLPDVRGSGLATRLLALAESALAAEGPLTAVLDCALGNEQALRFYERQGWRVTETIERQFETGARPVPVRMWSMEKALAPPPGKGH